MDKAQPKPTTPISSGRLPSFKTPRDLTLSKPVPTPNIKSASRPRRNVMPNIPPKRDKGSASSSLDSSPSTSAATISQKPSTSSGNSQSTPSSSSANSGRGGKNNKRGELIQSGSIFSEGVGVASLAVRRPAAPSGNIRLNAGGRSKARFSEVTRVKTSDPTGSNSKLSENLIGGSGDFIADVDVSNITDLLEPYTLPLASYVSKFYEDEDTSKKKEEDKPGPSSQAIKTDTHLDKTSFSNLINNVPEGGRLVYFQLPDKLPVLDQSAMDTDNPITTASGDKIESKLAADISSLPEGYIGKIQIMASGKAKFVLGDNSFDIQAGKTVGFRQDLAAINVEDKKMTLLGPVTQKFICVPEIETMLQQIL